MKPMKLVTRTLLGLLLLGAGVYAGILISYSFGLYPTLKFMPLRDYAVWWNTHDRTTAIRLVRYETGMAIFYFITLAMIAIRRRWVPFAAILLSYCLMLGEFYVNHHQQAAINYQLHHMDTYTVNEDELAVIRSRTFKVLRTREYLAGISFGLLCMGVSLYGVHLDRKTHKVKA
ncbi:MAG: hypothetical protein JSS87_08490 [Acidobacteria bacterium]|nr:hypothetical protein [Acidobacteriota bacterium]